MDENEKEEAAMKDFMDEVMDASFISRMNRGPLPARPQIEYHSTSTPMSPQRDNAPSGRRGMGAAESRQEAAVAVTGSFCGTKVVGGDTVIPGGLMVCGDKNFLVPDYVISLGSDSEDLVQITLSGIECNADDDEEIFLPGVKTASGTPAWDLKAYSPGTNYDDTTNPSSPSGTGDIVVGLGRLIVEDGVATFVAEACGSIVVTHCAGTIGHQRQ